MMIDTYGRLQIEAVRVIGRGKRAAEIRFSPGFNVVSGASNTGKSYILQCIDYALGSSKPPKPIEASAGYESVQVDLTSSTRGPFTIERSLKGGDAELSEVDSFGSPLPRRVLTERHSSKEDSTSISGFLLERCGLWGSKVRLNREGQVRSLSFRDIVRLVLVDETRIISELSPALSGQYVNDTVERSVLSLLLSGIDDSSIIAMETRKQRRLRLKTQIQVLGQLIDKTEGELHRLDGEPDSLRNRKQALDSAIRTHREQIEVSTEKISEQEQVREDAWRAFQRAQAERSSNEELLARFRLLEKHYMSDISRLQAIAEADHFFRQLRQERCPLCGAPPESHDDLAACRPESAELINLREACVEEMAKISVLSVDLSTTIANVEREISRLNTEATRHREIVRAAAVAIKEELAPKAASQQLALEQLFTQRTAVAEASVLLDQIREMRVERAECEEAILQKMEEPSSPVRVMSQAVEGFTLGVQRLLESWSYPGLTRVTFSEEDSDLVISGHRRTTEGKGLRAISYAGFVIGLMYYCKQAIRPHPGFVVLDSPLVTYKRRDTQKGETIPDDVKSSFFTVLADAPPDMQIIVLENEDPPADVLEKINYLHFSRSEEIGRYGFFPS